MAAKRLLLLALVLFSSPAVAGAAETGEAAESPGNSGTAEVLPLLQTFVSELVAVTPGKEPFPKELLLPSSDDRRLPPRRIAPAQPFSIARYEVPQNLYQAVMGRNPSRWQGPRNSAEMMTWNEARDFCTRLTQLLRTAKLIRATEEIRLPTEVEWEYCCRAGTVTAYSFGDAAQAEGDDGAHARLLDAYAWHTGNAAGNDPPVGALKPNPWGLYDMHGYLWEFCSDVWTEPSEPPGPADERLPEQIVIRGGSWKDRFEHLTSSSRREFGASQRDDAVGFRCVCAGVAP